MNYKIASLIALTALMAAPLAASAQPHTNGNGGYNDGRYNDGRYNDQYGSQGASGVIDSANSGDLTLRNGRTIYLKRGTIIEPRGQSLQAGQRIAVRGTPAGDGNINAQAIRIIGDARYGNGYSSDDGNRGRRRHDRNQAGDDRRYDNRDNRDDHDTRDRDDH